jgi:hypothetical protein
MDLTSVTVAAPVDGFVLLTIVFLVQLNTTAANSGYIFGFGYGTSGGSFVNQDGGAIYQTPSDFNGNTFTYVNRISAATGSHTYHALFQATSGTIPPGAGSAQVQARINAEFVSS